ncbi:uncharacterized protein LOC122394209 isoform X1 [Amphibalanus amphitrite]|uniref:uncharacterized protein LOC122394209 isoform X1 n=1 Tax=Amphibalanus amphitrite TaxID=1232801 RepID=UPI001C8FCE33|nr:uncharacterized protein LOC122394209 isoform X1 [Amphibalanus amphitrite]
MELCLLLLVVMAVGVASTDNNNNNNSSGGGGGSGSPFPSLQCGPVNRRGRRLWGKPRPVHPPSVCEKSAPSRGAVLCDEPGDDYPWEAIDNYLRQSSDVVKKRVENTLKASRIVAANAVRRRNARSADQVVKDSDAQEITFATDSSDKIRAKKHIDPPPGNLNNAMTWEGSGTHDDTETDPTSIGDSANLTFSEDSLEGSGDETTSNEDAKATNDDLDFLVSYFLRDEPVDDMTKDAIKDMLKFRKTFVTPSGREEILAPPTQASDKLTQTRTPTSTPTQTTTPTTVTPSTVEQAPATDSDDFREKTTIAHPKSTKPSKIIRLEPAKRSESDVELKQAAPNRNPPTDVPEDDLLASTSDEDPVAAMPEALPLIASPPKIVHFNPPSVTVRQRVTVAKTTPPRPTTFGPELDDFTELVYASGTQRQPEEAEVAPPATRAPAPPPPSTVEPTPDPYTQSACDYWEELRSPFYAMNTHSEWKTLINMPNYETYIHMEHCKEDKSQGRCAEGCRCTQKFTIRNMPVYDRDINGCDVIYMDEFLFPSHCDCKCLPPGYTLFQRPPEPTTPLPEVAEFSESVPEGWLPERPTTGRNGQKEKEEEEEEKEVVREEVIEVEEADGEEEVVVVEVVEREKGEEKPVTSVGSPEKLKSDSPPSGDEERSESQEKGTEERRSQARPPPPAIRRHVTVRPRPRRPTAGPKLPSPRPAAGPLRWELLAQRQRPERRAAADSETSHRNRLRGPAEAPAELNRR